MNVCDGWKLLINDKIAKIENVDIDVFFERGIILLRNSDGILDKNLIKKCKYKSYFELTKLELKEINPEIIIPFKNGIVIAKGISLSFNYDFYNINKEVDVFIYLNKANIMFISKETSIKESYFTEYCIKKLISYYDKYGVPKNIPIPQNLIERIEFSDNTYIEIETFVDEKFIRGVLKESLMLL